MAKIIFENSGEEVFLENGSSITECCEDAGVPFACSEGVCGTCVVEVRGGMENLSAPTQEEIDFLGEDMGNERLACQCKLKEGDLKLDF